MLAYVFWHWPTSGMAEEEYRARLAEFHAALRHSGIPGLRRSYAFACDAAPWAPTITSLYEDWYLVDDFAALGALNDGAIAHAQRTPHDAVAKLAAGGMAGVYRLWLGDAGDLPDVERHALWFHKPATRTYEALLAQMQPRIEQTSGALWQRQMTLGPAPEFCWWAAQPQTLPSDLLEVSHTTLTPVR